MSNWSSFLCFHLHILVGKILTANYAAHVFRYDFQLVRADFWSRFCSEKKTDMSGLDLIWYFSANTSFFFNYWKNTKLIEINLFVEAYQGWQITQVEVWHSRRMWETQIHGLHQMYQRDGFITLLWFLWQDEACTQIPHLMNIDSLTQHGTAPWKEGKLLHTETCKIGKMSGTLPAEISVSASSQANI